MRNEKSKESNKRTRISTYEKAYPLPSPLLENGFFHILNAKNGRGKTTYLKNVSKAVVRNLNLNHLNIISSLQQNGGAFTNLICLAGTAFDKFEKYITFKNYLEKNGRNNTFYYYTGYTSNSNMSTLQIPFRTLFEVLTNFLAKNPSVDFDKKSQYLSEKLTLLGFEDKLDIQLQPSIRVKQAVGNNKKGKVAKDEIETITITLSKSKDINNLLMKMDARKLEINDLIFWKKNEKFQISELSSGEYSFLRALFTLCLAIDNHSLIIYDEPENSLHPEWQTLLIKYIIEITKTFGKEATVLIATHSPLVTTSFSIEKVKFSEYIDDVDDTNSANNYNFAWNEKKYYGWNANSILTEQFEMISARSREFIDEFNLILDAYHQQDWDSLKMRISELEKKDFQLPEIDNLLDIYNAVKKELDIHLTYKK